MSFDVSVLILTHNSYTEKAGCIEFVLNAYLNQCPAPNEIIVIDNGSDAEDRTKLHKFCCVRPEIKVITCELSIGAARNYGADKAKSEYLLFNDDDTIPVQTDVISRIQEYTEKGVYGYGANRLWSPDLSWVISHRDKLTKTIKNGDFAYLKENSNIPPAEIRMKNEQSLKILLKSFIGNFGLIRKQDFLSVGGFPDFPGYACEDDALSFLCYLKFGRPMIFNDIELVHISHPLTPKASSDIVANQKRLRILLQQHGYSEFHISRLLFEKDDYIIK